MVYKMNWSLKNLHLVGTESGPLGGVRNVTGSRSSVDGRLNYSTFCYGIDVVRYRAL